MGVVALVDIPNGVDPFALPNSHLRPSEVTVVLRQEEVNSLPVPVADHALSFFAAVDDPRDPLGKTTLRDAEGGLVYGFSATGFCGLDTCVQPPMHASDARHVPAARRFPPRTHAHARTQTRRRTHARTQTYARACFRRASPHARRRRHRLLARSSWYVNHGEEPNVTFVECADGGFNSYRTCRPVRAGEELLADYRLTFPEMFAAFGVARGGRRAALERAVRAADAAAAQVRRELEALERSPARRVP